MRGIPYLMDFSEVVNEAHLRPWPKNLRKRRKKQYLGVEKIKNDEEIQEREPSRNTRESVLPYKIQSSHG